MMVKNNGGINEDIPQRLSYKHIDGKINKKRINKCINWLLKQMHKLATVVVVLLSTRTNPPAFP
jgi:hypothetical protein